MKESFTMFEGVIFALQRLKEHYNLDFTVKTFKDQVIVTVTDGKRANSFSITENQLMNSENGYVDIFLEKAVEFFK